MTHYAGRQDATAELPAGSKRAKLKGYLKAANDLRQSYQTQYSNSGWAQRGAQLDDFQDGVPGAYPDAAVVTSGDEQMILFPSYARKHVKQKQQQQQQPPAPTLEGDDRQGDFMKQQWEEYKEDNAVVDVDVRGWVFAPHKGQMSRKQRVFVSIARQVAGLPAPPSPTSSGRNSRDASPHSQYRKQREDDEAARQAEELVRKGEKEATAASKGEYSEGARPTQPSRTSSVASSKKDHLETRAAWNHPDQMTPEEVATANAHLMARLAPFMSNPLSDTPISAFFYNDTVSRQRTIYTSNYGHFNLRASLDFIPTHVRILASETLSATEEVLVTPAQGVSLISDVDDTIKHSAISSGAREIFRNAFIRDLADLNINGVVEWYQQLADMGVKFHYVSNSPWQLYPVLHRYFDMSGLPRGSFHLKQYSGMLQGIFEPVAERKKGTLDRIANDFPERRFILVGDSGEADLEVYLDFVAENPGRVLAIFIRDVTTPHQGAFFDSNVDNLTNMGGSDAASSQQRKSGAQTRSNSDEDPELKAAIAASLKTLEDEDLRNRPQLPRRPTEPPKESGDLIDLSDDPPAATPTSQRSMSNYAGPPIARFGPAGTNGSSDRPRPPSVPRKPVTLQSKNSNSSNIPMAPSPSALEETHKEKRVPPPPPVRRSTAASTSSSLHTQFSSPSQASFTNPGLGRQNSPSPSIASLQTNTLAPGYREAAKQKLAGVYNALPAAPWNNSYTHTELNRNSASYSTDSNSTPRGRGIPGPATAARALTNTYASYTDPGRTSKPEQSIAARPYSTNTGGGENPYRNTSANYGNAGQPVNKRLELWVQRWTRAQEYCRERGVVLRSWRVGGDVVDECARLVEKAKREDERGQGK